jgi:frataxin-like iron-binding protein CyaY
LGFPILKGRPKNNDFLFIIEKMQSRLASWKTRLLNKPGRLALASSVLSSIPNYYMQIAWLPQNICDSIDQASRNFIWKNANNKGIHLVSWKKMTKPKKLGGLGLRSARDANICLLGKLVWDILQSKDKLWVNIFSHRYDAGIKILQASDKQGSSHIWSSIIRAKAILREGFTWRVGSGSSSFWFCPWSVIVCFSKLVPYIDIHDLQLTVKDVINSNNPHSHILYTNLPHTALDITNNTHTMFNDQIADTFIWSSNKSGVYTTKSGYEWILSRTEQPDHLVKAPE